MLRNILLASAAIAITPAAAQSFDSAAVSGLGIRNIGSATMSGRIAAVAGRQEADGKVTLLIGSASGGVWKSEDGGTTFKPVFDKQPVQSIGAVAMDPTNKDVMWVGSGEAWTRNSVSVGNGVYKSTDGGETWTNVGLPGTERIDRIIVHPKNGNIVYVCAPGPLWSDSADRGLYKTIDGGKSWSLILKGTNLSTGCSSVAMDPANPERTGSTPLDRDHLDSRIVEPQTLACGGHAQVVVVADDPTADRNGNRAIAIDERPV